MMLVKCLCLVMLSVVCSGHFNTLHAVDEQRKAYDEMVEEATREAEAYVQEKQKEQMESDQEAQDQPDSALTARVAAERQRLETEMDTVRNRGMGPDFTEGMRANRLQELEEALNRLNGDPDAYFAGE